MGRLVWGDPGQNVHCTDDDYTVPEPHETESESQSHYKKVDLINIVMVRRGKCSFTTKVKVARKKGAHAVIIVDKEDSTLKTSDIRRIIVADDGYGDTIHIPSVLIAKDEGNKLIAAVKQDASASVVVELKWTVPTNSVVEMDLWMSSASKESAHFLREFAPKRKLLNRVMKFHPHYAVFSLPSSDKAVYNELCLDSTGKFCAEDPDGSGKVTGKMVLEEDVRQLCIHEVTKIQQFPMILGTILYYAEPYWEYVRHFLETCPLDAENPQDRFGTDCAERVMRTVGIDVARVQKCMIETTEEKLQEQRENQAWSPHAVRINGWRYSGILDADLVARALCAGFVNKPDECKALIRPRDPFKIYTGAPVQSGVGWFTFFVVLTVSGCLLCTATVLYSRHLKMDVRTALREEVMLEVQAQMGEYSKLRS